MVSTFNEFLLTVNSYALDIIALSETWLKDNPQLMEYVSIPGYATEFRHREDIKGGGVGVYIKEDIKYKRRLDIEKLHPELEHLWLEVPGRNIHSKALVGVMYRSIRMLSTAKWLESLESLLSQLTVTWDGMLILIWRHEH
jgi:exonuclease III